LREHKNSISCSKAAFKSAKMNDYISMQKLTTAVLRYCSISYEITFRFHNFVLSSRANSVPISATVAKPQDVMCHYKENPMNNLPIVVSFLFFSIFSLAQDLSKITFIKDKSQSVWLFGESKISKLNEKEFKQLEKLIRARINEYNKNANKKNLIEVDKYFRQYIVVENEKDEKEIWVNFLCEVSERMKMKWKTEIISTSDGGKCYLNLTVNLTLKKVEKFIVNGRA